MSKTKSYVGMSVVEAKLRMLADAANEVADAYHNDPVRKACKKAGVKQYTTTKFFDETLNILHEAMLRVDNIVHGWEAESIVDAISIGDEATEKKLTKFLKYNK